MSENGHRPGNAIALQRPAMLEPAKAGLSRLLPFLGNGNGDGTKAMLHAGGGNSFLSWLFTSSIAAVGDLLPRTKKDWAKAVGDGLGSSVLAGPLNFLMRTFPEAPPMVERLKRSKEWEEDVEHPLTALLAQPNKYYSGEVLWMCTALDYAFGNAYWYKIRNEDGVLIELWWLPRGTVQPKWPLDGRTYVSHYEYRPGTGAETVRLAVDDVVHMRFGLDPRNPRLGLSPLGALVREIGVDDEAANFTGSILENLGIIGVIISPEAKAKGSAPVSKEAVKAVKDYIQRQFTGDKRGETLAVGSPTKAQLLQYNLQGFDISPLRDVSEERVCAAMGLPAAVVGFGTGLQQTKVGATMKEMRQLAWTGGIIPLQRIIAAEIQRSLLHEFERGKRQRARFRFDVTQVRALWEDQNEKHTRVREDYKAGLIDRAAALRETSRPATEKDVGVYYSGKPATEPATTPKNPPPADDSEDVVEDEEQT